MLMQILTNVLKGPDPLWPHPGPTLLVGQGGGQCQAGSSWPNGAGDDLETRVHLELVSVTPHSPPQNRWPLHNASRVLPLHPSLTVQVGSSIVSRGP